MEPNTIMKIIGAGLIILSTAIIGRTYAKGYKERVDYITDFMKRLELFKNEIGFMKGILADAFSKASEFDGKNQLLFKEAAQNLSESEAGTVWEEACEKYLPKFVLKREDIEIIKSLGRLLGISDIDGQISNIESISSGLSVQKESAEAERKKNEPLFRNMGVLAGIGVAVFLM